MEHVREALEKAKATEVVPASPIKDRILGTGPSAPERTPAPAHPSASAWKPRQVTLDPAHLESSRVVGNSESDPSLVPFNLLRTKLRKIMGDLGWHTLGITSPTPGCGKTTVATNLALSMARVEGVRVVLIDLDLRKPFLARTLGIKPVGTINRYLVDKCQLEDCFVGIGDGLVVGLNGGHLPNSSELIRTDRMESVLSFVDKQLAPDIVLYDLPPMGSSDDVLAFLPYLDSALLIAAAGTTTVAEVDECERQLHEHDKFCGVVLNKGEKASKDYYYY